MPWNHSKIDSGWSCPKCCTSDYAACRLRREECCVSSGGPTVITSIIDWQQTCIEPASIYSHNTPDFAAPLEKDPSEEDGTPKNRNQEQLLQDISICHQIYDAITTYKCRNLRPGRQLDSTLFRLFHSCFTSWRDGILAIRQELIDFRTFWPKLELDWSVHIRPRTGTCRTCTSIWRFRNCAENWKCGWRSLCRQSQMDGYSMKCGMQRRRPIGHRTMSGLKPIRSLKIKGTIWQSRGRIGFGHSICDGAHLTICFILLFFYLFWPQSSVWTASSLSFPLSPNRFGLSTCLIPFLSKHFILQASES